jgi:hypothetical protein
MRPHKRVNAELHHESVDDCVNNLDKILSVDNFAQQSFSQPEMVTDLLTICNAWSVVGAPPALGVLAARLF